MNNLLNTAEAKSILMGETIAAMDLLAEILEKESHNPSDDPIRHKCFSRRFPAFMSVYNVIARDLRIQVTELDDAVLDHYGKLRQQKE